jgi:hypothetical protein
MTVATPSRTACSVDRRREHHLSKVVAVMAAVLLSLVPLVALEAIGASPAGADASCPCSLWSAATVPAIVDVDDAQAVELGVQFSSATDGFITGVRFYKAAANTGEHIGSLWTANGVLLANATFTSESDSGWQQVSFATPVAVVGGTRYVASYHTDTGHYSADPGYFVDHGYTNGPLSAPGGDTGSPNGLYAYSPSPTFPTGTFNGNNYWVDVTFSSATAPVSVTVSSVQGSQPKGTSQQLGAIETFSDGTTKNVTTTAAWTSSNPAAGSVSASGLFSATGSGSTTVTATIGGTSGQTVVAVLAPVAFLAVNPLISVISAGQTKQLSVTARLTDGSSANVSAFVRWGTLLGFGPTINSTGLVTGGRVGASIFTATLGRSTGVAAVVVLPRGFW